MKHQKLVENQLEDEQDNNLDQITRIAHNLHEHANDINLEIGKQGEVMEDLGEDIDKTNSRFGMVNKKLEALLKTSDTGTIYTIVCLFLILMVLITLVVFG
mmetsp:Transcript_18972/g.21260  ORF Transcript_18972/g.21260 Transcript_18972/m.21260 type:complete len:101 (-) Transcript_18972:50-352(-)